MTCSPAILIALLCSPLVVLAMHATLSRQLSRALAPQAVAVLAALSAAAPMAVILHAGDLAGKGNWLYAGVVYSGLAYAYLHLFNLSETARRLKILFALDRQGEADLAELEERYGGAGAVLSVRMERLLATGSVVKVNGRWFLRHHALAWAAKLVLLWRRVLFT